MVELGCTDTVVRRSPDGRRFAKTAATDATRRELTAERDRLRWLASTPIPVPGVLAWEEDRDRATLLTTALPGVPASDLSAEAAVAATESLVRLFTDLHSLPTASCPFDRTLAVTVPLASASVAAGLVDEEEFDTERRGRSATALLDELTASRGRAAELEPDDLVICHGDACLPNVLVDPETLEVTGIVDVGRLGVADRHLDLALLTRSMSIPGLNPGYGTDAAQRLLVAYPTDVDPWRLEFYRLLDEFF